ncbi:hypothetical protein ACFLVY_00895 [Chloroflexota bacterium]
MSEDRTSILNTIALICVCVLIHAIGWENLPKNVQSELEKAGRKLIRWRRENPVVSLDFDPAQGENQRRDAILNWLGRPEVNLRNGG